MKPSLIVFGFGLLAATIGVRTLPPATHPPGSAGFGLVAGLSIWAAVVVGRIFRTELRRIGKPAGLFPWLIGFVTWGLCIQAGLRMWQLVAMAIGTAP